MDSYCVIHFKDKPEKVKILTFLASETEAKYHVTTDLKEYAATIADNSASAVPSPINTFPLEQQHSSAPIVAPSPINFTVSDQQIPVKNKKRRYIETITIKDEIDETVENVVTTTTNSTLPIILPTPIDINVVDRQVPIVPVIDTIKEEIDETVANVVSPMAVVEELESGEIVGSPAVNNNALHNFIFLQPSDITVDQQNLTNVPTTGKDATGVTTATIKDVPSTSEGNRKRPNYSMVDHNDNETAVKKRKDDEQEMDSGNEKEADKCQKCTSFSPQFQSRVEHALKHLKIIKYHCMVGVCRFKNSYKYHILDHMKKNHATQLECFRELALTREQQQKMEEVKKTCFTGIEDWNQCQFCNLSIRERNPMEPLFQKRLHAIYHLGIKLYKCTEEGCCFKGATRDDLNKHKHNMHGGGGKENYQKDELTEEQESQVEEMLVKCFPNLDDTNFEEVDSSNA